MRYVNADPARGNVYLWSRAPLSVDRAYHRIWGWVKSNAPSATSWGQGGAYAIVQKTIGKLSHQFCRSVLCNDECTFQQKIRQGRSRPCLTA